MLRSASKSKQQAREEIDEGGAVRIQLHAVAKI